jgi:hypothetical protein
MKRHFLFAWPVLVVALVASCGKDDAPGNPAPDGGSGTSAGTGGGTGTSTGTGGGTPGDGGLVPCLDRPTELERPPNGELPCDLLPPGFTR